jgi:hypothetical protein
VVRQSWGRGVQGAGRASADAGVNWLEGLCHRHPALTSPSASHLQVEAALGVEGDDILYVGDHIYTDAALAKINFRCRDVERPPSFLLSCRSDNSSRLSLLSSVLLHKRCKLCQS